MPTVAVRWHDPFTTCQQLDLLPGAMPHSTGYGPTMSWPLGVSADGNTIVGWAADSSGNRQPVKWVGTAIMPLTTVSPAAQATACSADASIIMGDSADSSIPGLVRWTSGGLTGSLLPPGIGTSSSATPGDMSRYLRPISDDNSVIAADSVGSGVGRATKWVGVTPTALPSPSGGSLGYGCSADGSVVVGQDVAGGSGVGCFWLGTTCHLLVRDPGTTILFHNTYSCNGDGSVVFGSAGQNVSGVQLTRPCYWDSLSTTSSGRYGVLHFLQGLTPITGDNATIPTLAWMAETTSPIAVGSGVTSSTMTAYHGIRWNGAVPTDLGGLPGSSVTVALGCSSTGGRVCGTSRAALYQAVYWDDANALHALPTLADQSGFLAGEGMGMSRNGATIFGLVSFDPGGVTPPPSSAKLAMDNLTVTAAAQQLAVNLISLRWSDDRGHSWGSPVTQDIGEAGEYRTSLQWQRMAYARDRVFEISWSVPMRTALQGCWVDVTPAQS